MAKPVRDRAARIGLRLLPVVALLLLVTQLSGCESLGYYRQAVSGQLYILTHRQPIERLLGADADIPPRLRSRLELVRQLRAFADDELRLPLEKQFSYYLDLQRPYVVWNVFATGEFSLRPKTWCYPVAGCVSYRGYFDPESARAKAAELRESGLDVYVGGVTAYSTLGWFADPVLNTVIDREPHQLAGLIFHELAHQLVYLKGDTEFNESFATAVEQIGVERWMRATLPDEEASALTRRIAEELRRREQFVALVREAADDLAALYRRRELEAEEMRRMKQRRIDALRASYRALDDQWGGPGAYDGYFGEGLNNARIATVSTYHALVPAFHTLLQQCADELDCFYGAAKELSKLPELQRKQALAELMPNPS